MPVTSMPIVNNERICLWARRAGHLDPLSASTTTIDYKGRPLTVFVQNQQLLGAFIRLTGDLGPAELDTARDLIESILARVPTPVIGLTCTPTGRADAPGAPDDAAPGGATDAAGSGDPAADAPAGDPAAHAPAGDPADPLSAEAQSLRTVVDIHLGVPVTEGMTDDQLASFLDQTCATIAAAVEEITTALPALAPDDGTRPDQEED